MDFYAPFCFNRLQPIRRAPVLGVVPGATQQPASYLRQFYLCLTRPRREFSDHKPHGTDSTTDPSYSRFRTAPTRLLRPQYCALGKLTGRFVDKARSAVHTVSAAEKNEPPFCLTGYSKFLIYTGPIGSP